ncbi:MAG: PD-(D/E)XK nuclease family protein [Clostridiales bacterium]|nr:PD-(D/E)XK nuclease family protein [Clostridiales bacterium]
MLHIYTGREDIDKQRWMFERIRQLDVEADRKRPIYLIVPDQFTLEAERSAFTYMDVPAFINPIILSMNRLAGKVLAEAGDSTEHIDRYGNYMLLARLLYRNKKTLELYRGLENSTKFIEQLSEAIMSLKLHLVTPEALMECAEAVGAGDEGRSGAGEVLLGKKLRDVAILYAEYERMLADSVPDGTDVMRLFTECIRSSKLLEGAAVWVYGFDYFSPLHLSAIGAMAARSAEVNIVLTAEKDHALFSLTIGMIEKLEEAARKAGTQVHTISVKEDAAGRGIDCAYLPDDAKPPEIAHVEHSLFAGPARSYQCDNPVVGATTPHFAPTLRFIVARDYYSEAEAAAATILHLVRNENLRYRDILVVCNNQDRRAPAIQRVFSAHGIETFLDKRYDVGYNPVLAYITALPEIISRGRRPEDVLRWVGTGLTDICEEDAEELENHAARYGIKDRDDDERITNTIRYINEMLARFSERFGVGGHSSEKTARARTDGLKAFLENDARLPEKIAAYADRLEAEGFLGYAAHMRSVWDAALNIFTQITTVLGDVETNAEEYATILRVGFASIMMGVLPASSDCVTIGTMQRTRTGRVKAMLVLGANDGELPMFAEDSGLLDDAEKETLGGLGLDAFRREESLHHEEQLAIYKNLSKPTRLLYLSYTAFDTDGRNETKPSRIFERLRAMFPDTPLEKDSDLTHGDLTQRDLTHGDEGRSAASPAARLPRFESGSYALGADRMSALIPPVLSPTAIEKYSRCPFAFLMDRGLKLREIRKHEIDSRGMGDVYHEALKRFGNVMNDKGGAPANKDSAWNTATRNETDTLVNEVFLGMEKGDVNISPEGALLFALDDPAAAYRLGRLKSITKDICWALTERAADSGAEQMFFEADFGDGGDFDTLHIDDGFGIAGRIDRIDVMPGGRAKVLDYKSGYEKWNSENVRSGWQLQLMLYLKAIEETYEPAGVSYFRLFEPTINLSDPKAPTTPEEISEALLREYRSDGIALDDNTPVPSDNDATDTAAPATPSRPPFPEKTISPDDFNALRAEVDQRLAEIASGLADGLTPAAPKSKTDGDRASACQYCDYRSICNYEPN